MIINIDIEIDKYKYEVKIKLSTIHRSGCIDKQTFIKYKYTEHKF